MNIPPPPPPPPLPGQQLTKNKPGQIPSAPSPSSTSTLGYSPTRAAPQPPASPMTAGIPGPPAPPPPPPPMDASAPIQNPSPPPPPNLPPPASSPHLPPTPISSPSFAANSPRMMSASQSVPRCSLPPPPPPPLSTLPHSPPPNIHSVPSSSPSGGDANNNAFESPPIYQSISVTSTQDTLDDSFDDEIEPAKEGAQDDLRKNMDLLDILLSSILLNTDGSPKFQTDIQSTLSEIIYYLDSGTADEWNAKLYISDEKEYNMLTMEIKFITEMKILLEEGERQASMLYTWRPLSKAIPKFTSGGTGESSELYNCCLEVMEPYINKLQKFRDFVMNAVSRFIEIIEKILLQNTFVTQSLRIQIAKTVNLFAVLDELINSKTSILNDYTFYKRVKQNLHGTGSSQQALPDVHNLGIFLATKNRIFTKLKEVIDHKKLKGFEDFFCDIINECLSLYFNKQYFSPSDKHVLIKFVAFGLFLIDSQFVDATKLDKLKKLNISKIDKAFKNVETLPLYGDMVISPFQYVSMTKHFDPSKWTLCMSEERNLQGNISKRSANVQSEMNNFITKLRYFEIENKGIVTKNNCQRLYKLAIEGLQLLSSWTALVTEVFSWKLHKPADYTEEMNKALSSCPDEKERDRIRVLFEETKIYEYATKHNYDDEEKIALITVIASIKTVQKEMKAYSKTLSEGIRKSIYYRTQKLIKEDLRDTLRKAVKNGKEKLRNLLVFSRETIGHWPPNYNPNSDPILQGKKMKDLDLSTNSDTCQTTEQTHLLRTILEYIISSNPTGVFAKKNLEKDTSLAIEDFLSESFLWEQLLNFDRTLKNCCDLSQLWFREFFIELAKGERVQFEAESSMPFILIDFLVEHNKSEYVEYVFYAFDLYNDSADYALNVFKKKFLYEEIEAEVDLCFEQFLYKLCDHMYNYYRTLAGSLTLKSYLGNHVTKKLSKDLRIHARRNFLPLLSQTNIRLLGRNIDLKRRISQRLNMFFSRSLENVLHYFESVNLHTICEIEGIINVTKLAHKLISEHITLTPFEHLLQMARYDSKSDRCRIAQRIVQCVTDDLPLYAYNTSTARFVMSEIRSKTEEARISKEKGGKEDKRRFMDHRDSWGRLPHAVSICNFLDYAGISYLLEECVKFIEKSLNDIIMPFVRSIKKALPPEGIKLPRYEYGHVGAFTKFRTAFVHILKFDLSDLYEALAGAGNCLAFCLIITENVFVNETNSIRLGGYFCNNLPTPYIEQDEKSTHSKKKAEALKKLKYENKNCYVRFVAENFKELSDDRKKLVKQNELLEREKLVCGLNIFPKILDKLKKKLCQENDKDLWFGDEPENGIMHITNCSEFYRVWSVLQFVFSIPTMSAHAETVEALYGDGLQWMGCSLIQLLGQERKFEVLDISYHIEKLYEPAKGGTKNKMNDQMYNKLMQRIRAMHKINSEIFGIVGKYCCTQSQPKESIKNQFETPLENVHHFDPPLEIDLDQSSAISIKTSLNVVSDEVEPPKQKVETEV
ncbi:DgyrCDS622 [Dimorphilus gyrociliatus]|uniref:DgyrCDS622 n=1 Tax=Dimorphilus gyrociliatus TaxID=2664684 RepID=A0A7I8V7Q2_9ANNE|nr:DgyrCDS622 [Dimorphilus gyrociliatus]